MARPIVYALTLAAASANNICASQTPAMAGALTINGSAASGGVATLDVGRRVIVTSAGNDSGITFTIAGTNQTGNAISQTITGANAGVAATTLDFLTVTSVIASGAAAAAVTAGTNATGSSPWLSINPHARPVNLSLASVLKAGTATWNVEYTYDDIQNTTSPPAAWSVAGMDAIAANKDGVLNDPVTGVRLTITAGQGHVALTVIQSGIKS